MESRKLATWDDKTFCLEFNYMGYLVPTIEAEELLWRMSPSIVRLTYKVKDTLGVPLDDCKQILYLTTLKLMQEWNPNKSKWGTWWNKYAYRRLINYVIVKKNGYRIKEYGNSDYLDKILTGGGSDGY